LWLSESTRGEILQTGWATTECGSDQCATAGSHSSQTGTSQQCQRDEANSGHIAKCYSCHLCKQGNRVNLSQVRHS